MTLKIERDKLYRTRSGEIRRVVCVDAPGPYPIVSIRSTDKANSQYLTSTHFPDGRHSHCCVDETSDNDLIAELREPREFVLRGGTAHCTGYIHIGHALLRDGEEIRVREVLEP